MLLQHSIGSVRVRKQNALAKNSTASTGIDFLYSDMLGSTWHTCTLIPLVLLQKNRTQIYLIVNIEQGAITQIEHNNFYVVKPYTEKLCIYMKLIT
jgi:hypothetical protein